MIISKMMNVQKQNISLTEIQGNNSLIKTIVFIAMQVIALISFIMCMTSSSVINNYRYMFMLPLVFFLLNSFLFFKITVGPVMINIPKYIIIFLLLLRNAVTPWVMIIDSFNSMLGIASFGDATHSILLISYETVAIYIFLAVRKPKQRKKTSKRLGLKIRITVKNKTLVYKVLFYGSLFICVAAFALIKELRTQYYTIFTKDITHIMQQTANYTSRSALRILSTSGEVLIGAMRLVLPSALMFKLSQKDSLLRLFSCFLIIFMQSLLMNDSNAYILMVMLSQLLFVYFLFPSYRKFIIGCTITVVVCFFALLYINRFSLDHYGVSLSILLQAYIPSIANTAGVMRMESSYNIWQIFVDIFQAIPFKNYFLGIEQGVKSTTVLWSEVNGSGGQIISMVGEGYYYFGNLLSPVPTCIIINMALKTYEKLQTKDNALLIAVYIYFAIYCAAAPFVYNFEIIMQCVLNRLIFMIIISAYAPYSMNELSKKKVVKNNKE